MARPQLLSFGHTARTHAFWRPLVRAALQAAPTPFFLLATEPVEAARAELHRFQKRVSIPMRHWLSCKTQPVRPLLHWWHRQGQGIEVVSEFEFLAARKEGFAADQILVNGPAKHRWLHRYPVRGLRVNFDSPEEASSLLHTARNLAWSVGLRCWTSGEVNPESPHHPTQFGITPAEAWPLLKKLLRAGIKVETLHFHLRTNVPAPAIYARALDDVAAFCSEAQFWPKYLDCGGGFPAPHVLTHSGERSDRAFDWQELAQVYAQLPRRFPGLSELWLENGRFLTARSGVLVVRIIDSKERAGLRYLICDGGRTMNALISQWETHELFPYPTRSGPLRRTAVYGPTCMAFDQLAERELPAQLQLGDHLVWMDAGAYHIPWETRFSHGCAAVLWHEAGCLSVVRPAERFEDWWCEWSVPAALPK